MASLSRRRSVTRPPSEKWTTTSTIAAAGRSGSRRLDRCPALARLSMPIFRIMRSRTASISRTRAAPHGNHVIDGHRRIRKFRQRLCERSIDDAWRQAGALSKPPVVISRVLFRIDDLELIGLGGRCPRLPASDVDPCAGRCPCSQHHHSHTDRCARSQPKMSFSDIHEGVRSLEIQIVLGDGIEAVTQRPPPLPLIEDGKSR